MIAKTERLRTECAGLLDGRGLTRVSTGNQHVGRDCAGGAPGPPVGSPVEPSSSSTSICPNAATWFYFSLFLAVALFFQFARPLSLRNLDLLTLFLLVPGFLLLQEAHTLLAQTDDADAGEPGADARLRLAAGRVGVLVRAVDLRSHPRPPAGVSPNLTTAGLDASGWRCSSA